MPAPLLRSRVQVHKHQPASPWPFFLHVSLFSPAPVLAGLSSLLGAPGPAECDPGSRMEDMLLSQVTNNR